MKYINALIVLASIAAAAAVPADMRGSESDMSKRQCDRDAVQRCILACNIQCIAAGPVGYAACSQGCSKLHRVLLLYCSSY